MKSNSGSAPSAVRSTPLNTEGLERARVVASWFLGDREWADVLIGAYNNPNHDIYQRAVVERTKARREGLL